MPLPPTVSSFDTTPLHYLSWGQPKEPHTVIIGIHGFCGAAHDFTGLANALTNEDSGLLILAFNLRGQGLDPVRNRRGDIESRSYWLRDLTHFTQAVKKHYPHAKIVWCAESLGSLIATHTFASTKSAFSLCDAMILLSPVVEIGRQIAPWKMAIAKWVARLCKNQRVPLDLFIGSQQVQVTQGAQDHTAQSQTNPWHIETFTLRQLSSIVSLIESMPQAAQSITCPTLVINGGNDFFTPAAAIDRWLHSFPPDHRPTHYFFKDSYHLMLYDEHAESIFKKTSEWLNVTIRNFPIASS